MMHLEPLFEEILSHPQLDEPRLRYAHSLDERGHPLGEFIHTQLRLGIQPACPIRGPNEGAGQHSGKAESLGELLVLDELLGFDPARHWVVAHRRPQVTRR